MVPTSPQPLTLPLVLIEPDEAMRGRLMDLLMQSGRVVRAFADVRQLSAELDPCGVDAILIPLPGSPQEKSGEAEPSEEAAHVREAACWIRQCATARSSGPMILALDAGETPASTLLQISALHRGATAILPCRDARLLKEAVEAQIRRAHSQGVGEGRPGEGVRIAAAAGAQALKNSERQVTLTPLARPASEALLEPGWVPTAADFMITEDDPIDLKLYERKAVLRAIAAAEGNRTLAAQLLGIGKSTLYRRLSEWRAETS